MERLDRFTRNAQDAAQRALELLPHYGDTTVGTEHLLLALLKQPGGTVPKILKALAVESDVIAWQLHKSLRSTSRAAAPGDRPDPIYISPSLKRVLDRSSEEASRTDDGYVGTAHLLLAIANEQGTMAARILARAGLTRRDILAALSRIRTAETAPGASDTDVQIEAKSGLQPQLVLRQGPNEVRIALRDTTALIEELSSAATELTRHQMKIGDRVQVKAYKSDGTCYRWWTATVETVAPDELALVTPAGHLIQDPGGDFRSKHALRVFYWPGKWYSLLEAYAPSGELVEIYVNISSPVEIEGLQMRFTDYELDVSRIPPGEARLEDEDEFQEAAVEYGYSEEFQRTCYEVAREALDLANCWVGRGMPADR